MGSFKCCEKIKILLQEYQNPFFDEKLELSIEEKHKCLTNLSILIVSYDRSDKRRFIGGNKCRNIVRDANVKQNGMR
jgi:hypothetical protein